MSQKLNDVLDELAANKSEQQNVGPDMSASELAKHFGEEVPKEVPPTVDDLQQIAARVKNLATGAVGANLTSNGMMLCNTYTHVLKSLYDFANSLEDTKIKTELKDLIGKHEAMPANFIAASMANVRKK